MLDASDLARQPAVGGIDKRTAIVHDWFDGLHGSERVVETMRTRLFAPGNEPDIYTFFAARERLPPALAASIVRESALAQLMSGRGDGGRWRWLLPYMWHYFRGLDLQPYDLVISSSHAYAKSVHRRREDALHVCYCHTPIRYVWLPDTERGRARGLAGIALRASRPWLRHLDLVASREPDIYVANSTAVRKRIAHFYGRDAVVVHPPVEVAEFEPTRPKDEGSFLWVGRLVAYKRPEVVAEAFRELPYRLTMVGVGPLETRFRRRLPKNVELLGRLARSELVSLYERSSGFIHVADEDFGISMVEALAAGTPVLGLARGGALDIVRLGQDGILVKEPTVDVVVAGVKELASRVWNPRELAERAQTFSSERFVARFSSLLQELERGIRG